MYVKWFDTVMFYYVILMYLVNVSFCQFSNFPPFHPPYVQTLARDGTQKTDAGIGRRTLQGTLQEGHRGSSAGQGKRRTDPEAALQGIPACSSGLPLVLHPGIPPGRLR
ncbi:unnamed protein product, partial [Staurois parvus]